MLYRVSFLTVLLIGLLFNSSLAQGIKPDKAAETVVKMLAGTYHNKTQAAADSDFFEIHLKMKPIWKDRKIGNWLYVEQAVAKAQDKPYRQRVYHVYSRPNGEVVSEIFSLSNPLRFAGAWKLDKPLDQLTPDSLLSRAGCEVILTKQSINGSNGYKGQTGQNTCPSDLRGASWATSEVTMTDKQLISWDRGYDKLGKQVWGATKGGYIFDKVGKLD